MAQTLQLAATFTLSPTNHPNKHSSSPIKCFPKIRAEISLQEHLFPPNAMRRKLDSSWMGGFSLGIDLGLSRTGLAISKGFSVRPLKVLELRGQKLEMNLIEIAQQQEVDEFIVGLPISSDGKETPQSNKVRSVAGRIAIRAAERGWRVYLQDEHGTSTDAMNRMINMGWRVYLQDEHGTSTDAMNRMINMGLSKTARKQSHDAYAAMMVLERYFSEHGKGTEMVLPKQLDLQEKLRKGPSSDSDDLDFF
ncbi:putative pre-16S rRNA nuclease, yqgF/RNase H-like domain, ribonuclease H-like superfamily [Helianthus anomalus]